MKNIYSAIIKFSLLSFSILAMFLSCSSEKGFTLTGSIPDLENGSVVYMHNWADPSAPVIDTAYVQDGFFRFEGEVASPLYVSIIIDSSPEITNMRDKKRYSQDMFIENGKIEFEASSISALREFPSGKRGDGTVEIKGSVNQDLYGNYKNQISGLSEELSKLNQEYFQIYHIPALEGKFNTEEGLRIVGKINDLKLKIRDAGFEFARENPGTSAASLVAYYILADNDVELTTEQVDQLFLNATGTNPGVFEDQKGNPLQFALNQLANQKRDISFGSDFKDLTLQDKGGKSVKLSEFIVPGKYNFVEFWASWCGPCRGEIPHLRHINKDYGDKINIISVSMDESKEEWEKAMKEEEMIWTQLVDIKGFAGEVTAKYHVYGIPYSVMISPEGKLVMGGLRGAHLDAAIIKLLN